MRKTPQEVAVAARTRPRSREGRGVGRTSAPRQNSTYFLPWLVGSQAACFSACPLPPISMPHSLRTPPPCPPPGEFLSGCRDLFRPPFATVNAPWGSIPPLAAEQGYHHRAAGSAVSLPASTSKQGPSRVRSPAPAFFSRSLACSHGAQEHSQDTNKRMN